MDESKLVSVSLSGWQREMAKRTEEWERKEGVQLNLQIKGNLFATWFGFSIELLWKNSSPRPYSDKIDRGIS